MWLARAFLVLLSVSTSGFAALTRMENRGDSTATVDADGAIESTVNLGAFEGANLIKLGSAIGVNFKTTLLDKISDRIGEMKSSDLLGAARTLGVGQTELDLAADAEDRRAALIQLIAKGASEREEPDDEESDDDDDGAYGSDDEDDEDDDDDDSLLDLRAGGRRRRRRRRRKSSNTAGYGQKWSPSPSTECQKKYWDCATACKDCGWMNRACSKEEVGCGARCYDKYGSKDSQCQRYERGEYW